MAEPAKGTTIAQLGQIRIYAASSDELDVSEERAIGAIRELSVAATSTAAKDAGFWLKAACGSRSAVDVDALMKLGAGKAVIAALRRHAEDMECAEMLLSIAQDLSDSPSSVPLFVADGAVRCMLTVLQNARAPVDMHNSCCCFLANMAREQVGTRAVLAAGAHKAAIASLRRFGSTSTGLVAMVCGLFASMCIYADGAEAFFAPGVSALIATNVLKCTREAAVVQHGCRLLLNAAPKCRDRSKLFDAN